MAASGLRSCAVVYPSLLSSAKSQFASSAMLPVTNGSSRFSMTADWMPGQPRPHYLDGSAPGDFGFNPLRLGEVPENLERFKESDLIHCRWAMLAVMAHVFGIMVDNLIWFGRVLCFLAFCGVALCSCPDSQNLELEYNMTVDFASMTFLCSLFSLLAADYVKHELDFHRREAVDAGMRAQPTLLIRCILFIAQIVHVAALTSTILMTFYLILLRSITFRCMGTILPLLDA